MNTNTNTNTNTAPVFLSASVPYRNPARYLADPEAVRDAVLALVAAVTPDRPLVFGGHPAISPMVWGAASTLQTVDRVLIYQSRMFAGSVPKEARFFEAMDRLIWTPAAKTPAPSTSPFDLKRSLATMRDWMIVKRKRSGNLPPLPRFAAAFFVGGMEGIEDEWELFTKTYPNVPAFPVGSTAGGARVILNDPARSARLAPRFRTILDDNDDELQTIDATVRELLKSVP